MHIVGHKKILEFLKKSMRGGKISHAYLFYGPENLGKNLAAEYFSSLLLGIKSERISKLAIHQDFIRITPLLDKKNISINQIRDLQKSLVTRPFFGSFKVAIIEDVEKMSLEAANSFLKFLEEPPGHAVLILITSKIDYLPKTIISRCQLVKFNPVSLKEVKDFLIKNYSFNQRKAENFARLSFGRPGLVGRFLDKDSFLSFQSAAKNFLLLFEKKFFERVEILTKNEDPALDIWEMTARDLLLSIYGLSPNLFFCQSEIKKLVLSVSKERLVRFLEGLLLTKKHFNVNINKKLALENLLLNI